MGEAKSSSSRNAFRYLNIAEKTTEKGEALALGWFQGEKNEKDSKPSSPQCHSKRKEVSELKSRLKDSGHFGGKKNETSFLRFFPMGGFENVLLVGQGVEKKWTPEVARQVGASVYLAQKREHIKVLQIDGESFFSHVASGDLSYAVQAFAEGYYLAGYEYKDLKKEEKSPFAVEGATLVGLKGSKLEQNISHALRLCQAVNFSRSLGDRPGNFLTPTEFGNLCAKMAKESGLKCTIFDGKQIQKEKMGLFWGVAKGSDEDPRMVILEHKGGKKTDKPVVLIGKGITFDSGGISLKPPARMEDMKYDMMGAATVAGVMKAVAELKLPLNVTGYIGASENMPGGRAQKPGDVQRSLSGKTVEIVNTDAEGRLVLADVIEYAQKEHPQAMMDFATLTGAVIDALGTVTTGIMGNHSGFLLKVKQASEVTGERVWELPLYEEYEEDLKSNYADIRNSGIREAGSSKAGTFLKFFVDQKIPWVHCDIAGSAYHRKDLNYHPAKYGAGVMVRLVTYLLENWSSIK